LIEERIIIKSGSVNLRLLSAIMEVLHNERCETKSFVMFQASLKIKSTVGFSTVSSYLKFLKEKGFIQAEKKKIALTDAGERLLDHLEQVNRDLGEYLEHEQKE
jgi:predicted transcriptional regulator